MAAKGSLRHVMLSVDPDSMTGVCSVCGDVRLKAKKRGKRFACRNAEKRWKGTGLGSVYRYGRTIGGRWKALLEAAAKKGMEFDITKEKHADLLQLPCEYCGQELNPTGSGLDRKDSSVGYILANVVPCCRNCNRVKNSILTYEEMKAAMNAVMFLRRKT